MREEEKRVTWIYIREKVKKELRERKRRREREREEKSKRKWTTKKEPKEEYEKGDCTELEMICKKEGGERERESESERERVIEKEKERERKWEKVLARRDTVRMQKDRYYQWMKESKKERNCLKRSRLTEEVRWLVGGGGRETNQQAGERPLLLKGSISLPKNRSVFLGLFQEILNHSL